MSDQIGYITELDDVSAVRTRYSMFIAARGVDQLIIETFSNGVDEILANRCNRVDVFKTNENGEDCWCVNDFSTNGIPLKTDKGEDGIISVCTKLFSGGKYDNFLYKSANGANGCGMLIVNALSKRLTVTTLAHDNNNNHLRYHFKDGKFIAKELIHLKADNPKNIYSTQVKFIPDPQYFKNGIVINEDNILHCMKIARYIVGDDKVLTLNGKSIENTYMDEFKGDNCVDLITESYKDKKTEEQCHIDIALYDDFDSGKIFKGIINTLESNEGTHKNVVQNLIKNKLVELAEKNKKTIQPNDILVPIRINCALQLQHIDFQEQVKATLSNDKTVFP